MRCASRVEKRKESQCALPRYQLSSINGHKCDDNNMEKTSPGSVAHGEAICSKCTYAAIKLERHVVGQTSTAINYFCVMCCWWIVMLVSHWKLIFFPTKQYRSAWIHKCACVIAEKHNQPWHSFNDKSANSIVSESDFSRLVYRRYLHVYYSSCQHSIQFSITNPFCSAAPSFLLPLFLSQLNVIEALAQHIPFAEQLRLSMNGDLECGRKVTMLSMQLFFIIFLSGSSWTLNDRLVSHEAFRKSPAASYQRKLLG